MYLTKIEAKTSPINGKGVFVLEKILKGTMVWKYVPGHDKAITVSQYHSFDTSTRDELDRVAYLSQTSNLYIYPPENDPALFTNHSTNNNLSARVDKSISEEPYFVANRDIEIGEELTNNYTEFDEALKQSRPDWI